jgi:hypothetical protein
MRTTKWSTLSILGFSGVGEYSDEIEVRPLGRNTLADDQRLTIHPQHQHS